MRDSSEVSGEGYSTSTTWNANFGIPISKEILEDSQDIAKYLEGKMAKNIKDLEIRYSPKDESVFFEQHITGVLLKHVDKPETFIDHIAYQALLKWFLDHGYDEKELERRNISVQYRVEPRS